uniref:MSH6 n=1 Tax=Arundo donax TaxID=35708 RepID=A0A0A9DAR0_ARUDO
MWPQFIGTSGSTFPVALTASKVNFLAQFMEPTSTFFLFFEIVDPDADVKPEPNVEGAEPDISKEFLGFPFRDLTATTSSSSSSSSSTSSESSSATASFFQSSSSVESPAPSSSSSTAGDFATAVSDIRRRRRSFLARGGGVDSSAAAHSNLSFLRLTSSSSPSSYFTRCLREPAS